MSFLLDPPLLAAAGAATERTLASRPRARAAARTVVVGSFIGVSAALYANWEPLATRWPTLGARSGREFMIGSGLASVDEESITPARHAAALSLFALYPLWFELGAGLGRR